MSIHISARPGEIEKIVLLAGDPLRAKYIADNFLQNVQLVSSTRNIYFFTGTYKDKPLTVGASGMGCPSIGIYSFELFTEYEADCIIRIGTCGAYTKKMRLFDLINAETACSESTYAECAFGYKKDSFKHHGEAFDIINNTAKELQLDIKVGPIHSGDVFYRAEKDKPSIVKKYKCLAAEMEAFALFANARYLKKSAATILTVSDIIPTHEKISADEREKALLPMMNLALEAVVRIEQ
ncbi:MAG TPA: purine-nucleoside phosphorylase [Chitinophagaceae bacterium]|nr:purine-nucleoside phosphorylase [Chitinophagaceae bacterium]